jgi:hypothetical protein
MSKIESRVIVTDMNTSIAINLMNGNALRFASISPENIQILINVKCENKEQNEIVMVTVDWLI